MGRTILLVEDNPDDAELALMALADTGGRPGPPGQRRRGGAGLPARRREPIAGGGAPRSKLPKVDGFEVLERLRAAARTRTLPVVLFTSSDTAEDIARAYALGANSYVRKPIEFGEYRATVARLGAYWLDTNLAAS